MSQRPIRLLRFVDDASTDEDFRRISLCLQLTMHCTNITAQKPSDTHGDVPTLIRLSKGEVLAKIGSHLTHMSLSMLDSSHFTQTWCNCFLHGAMMMPTHQSGHFLCGAWLFGSRQTLVERGLRQRRGSALSVSRLSRFCLLLGERSAALEDSRSAPMHRNKGAES